MQKIIAIILFGGISWGMFAQKGQRDGYEELNAHFLDGVREWILHNPRQAIRHFEQCLQLTDTVSAVYYYLAAAYYQQGDAEQASFYVQKALQVNPRNKWYKELEKKIRASAGVSTGKTTPRKSTKLPGEKDVLQRLREARNGLSEEAWREYITRTAEKYPFYPRVQWLAAKAAYEAGKWDDAENFLLNGMDFALNNPSLLKKFYALLREVYLKKGNTGEAKRYEKLLKELHE